MATSEVQRALATTYLVAKRRRQTSQQEVLATMGAVHVAATEGRYEDADLLTASLLREVGALRRRLQLEAIASDAVDGEARGAGQ